MKTKNILTTAILAVAGLALSSSAQAQNLNFNSGDLIMGFRATGGIGSTSTLMVALGGTHTLRDTTTNIFNLANIGTLLDATYGITAGNGVAWYERTDLQFGAAGAWSNSNPPSSLQNQDPEQTMYVTRARAAVGANEFAKNTTINNVATSGTATTTSNSIIALNGKMETGTLFQAAVFDTADLNTWEDFQAASGSGQFGTAWTGGIQQTFGIGSVGNYLGADQEGALDLYRVANTASGALGGYAGGTAIRAGEYQGALVINQAGIVSFDVVAVPEPATGMFVGLTALGAAVARRRRRPTASVAQANP